MYEIHRANGLLSVSRGIVIALLITVVSEQSRRWSSLGVTQPRTSRSPSVYHFVPARSVSGVARFMGALVQTFDRGRPFEFKQKQTQLHYLHTAQINSQIKIKS